MLLLYYISFSDIVGSLFPKNLLSHLYFIFYSHRFKKGCEKTTRFLPLNIFTLSFFWCRGGIAKRSICLSLIFLFSLKLKGSDWLLRQPQRLKSFLWFKCYTSPDILHTLIMSHVPVLVLLLKNYYTQAYCNMMSIVQLYHWKKDILL